MTCGGSDRVRHVLQGQAGGCAREWGAWSGGNGSSLCGLSGNRQRRDKGGRRRAVCPAPVRPRESHRAMTRSKHKGGGLLGMRGTLCGKRAEGGLGVGVAGWPAAAGPWRLGHLPVFLVRCGRASHPMPAWAPAPFPALSLPGAAMTRAPPPKNLQLDPSLFFVFYVSLHRPSPHPAFSLTHVRSFVFPSSSACGSPPPPPLATHPPTHTQKPHSRPVLAAARPARRQVRVRQRGLGGGGRFHVCAVRPVDGRGREGGRGGCVGA
jgi:hypothetical protein